MNRAQLTTTLAELHWSQTSLADLTGYSVRTIGRWEVVPAPIAAWLTMMVRHLHAHPAPEPTHQRPRSVAAERRSAP